MAVAALVVGAIAAQAPHVDAQATSPTGSASFHFTREDTVTVESTDPFTPPGAIPLVGDFAGGSSEAGRLDDIFWYTPGQGGEALWRTTGERSWVESTLGLAVTGSYTPLVGSFTTDDPKHDILWYAPGPAADWLWDFNDDGSITRRTFTVNGTYTPIVGSFSDDGADDIVWYAPGQAADSWWDFDTAGVTVRPLSINGTYTPVVGSFAGSAGSAADGAEDLIWYAPGATPDALWNFNTDHTITRTPLAINGSYTPVPGAFTNDGFADVIWYAPGPGKDYLWDFDDPTGVKTQTALTINGRYTPITGELFEESDHRSDILWFQPGTGADFIWDYGRTDAPTIRRVTLTGTLPPVLGAFELHPYRPEAGGITSGRGADILDRTD